MADRRFSYSESKSSHDDPPNSRLFIVCSKQLSEDEFRNVFSKFGDIEELWVVKDRNTGERKGVTYIKYSKTSEAANALEAMNGKSIGNTNRRLKVMIAASRDQGSKRDGNEEEKVQRLFVIVPKTMTDEELHTYFKTFGEIDYSTIIKDKETRQSKGFAYIKYFKFSHAAAAYEQCDRKFKAVFAEPRKPRQPDHNEKIYPNSSSYEPAVKNFSLKLPELHSTDSYCRLQVIASPMVNQDQLWKLFDIIPGMDYCQGHVEGRPRPTRVVATVVYSNPEAAAYACEKLHGFEYPLGDRLIVKPDPEGPSRGFGESSRSSSSLNRAAVATKNDILQLAETIAQATSLIQAAGLSAADLPSRIGILPSKAEPYCDTDLPDPKPLANVDAETAARCFVICTPQPPPASVLKDVFCRFGDLIDVYMLANRKCGYAKYASREAAESAIRTLNGIEVCGVRLKVIEAEERDNNRKRLRLDDGSN